jgi:ribonuclease P protein component
LAFKPSNLKFSFNKKEKLKSKKLIEQLFANGQSVSAFPLRLIFMPTTFNDGVMAKAGVSVSKRQFKTAVDRNRIKRLMREVYRLNKANYFNNISTPYAFMILYIGKDKPTLTQIETRMNHLFEKFLKKVSETEKLNSDAKIT